MKPEIKAKWLDALRSEDFEKGTGELHTVKVDFGGTETHSFCCLGVLCELAVSAGIVERRKDGLAFYYLSTDPEKARMEGEEDAFLPQSVQEWAGVNTSDLTLVIPDGPDRSRRVDVSTLNDDEFEEFEPIADLLERYLFEDNHPVRPDAE